MVATSGDRLLEPEAESVYEDLVAEAALVTPNADEAVGGAGRRRRDRRRRRPGGRRCPSRDGCRRRARQGRPRSRRRRRRRARHRCNDPHLPSRPGRHRRDPRLGLYPLQRRRDARLAHGDDLPSAVGDGVSPAGLGRPLRASTWARDPGRSTTSSKLETKRPATRPPRPSSASSARAGRPGSDRARAE